MWSRSRSAENDPDDGFTLIELLVVIIIIGILAAIAIPLLTSQRKKAVSAAQRSDLRNASTAFETYYSDYTAYPDTLSQTAGTTTVSISSGANPSATFYVSKGDTVSLMPSTGSSGAVKDGSYCVKSVNPDSNDTWYYDSDAGGIVTACQ